VETRGGERWSYCFEYGYTGTGEGYLGLKRCNTYLEMPEEEE
jgi:hypothetical protein